MGHTIHLFVAAKMVGHIIYLCGFVTAWQQSTHLNFDDKFDQIGLKQKVGRIIHLCGFVIALQQSTRLD